jgi:hemerythrin-like domain-containing protein
VNEELTGKGIGMLMAIHGAVRRDLDRVASAASALCDDAIVEADRRVGAKGLSVYWSCFAEQLHHHHSIEDTEVFPYLRRSLAAGKGAAVLDAMATEHEAIDEAQDATQAAMDALLAAPTAANAAVLRSRLAAFKEVVVSHLAHEEEAAVPLIVEGFDTEYWMAFMSRRQQEAGTDAFLPWVLDGAPAPAVDQVTSELPPPVRALLLEQWTPAHASRVAALPG